MPNVVFIYIRSHYIYAKRGFSHKKRTIKLVVLLPSPPLQYPDI